MMGLSWGRAEWRGCKGFFRFVCGNSALQTDKSAKMLYFAKILHTEYVEELQSGELYNRSIQMML